MQKTMTLLLILLVALFPCGCAARQSTAQVAATTAPVYQFTVRICQGTDVTVSRLVTENVSCLHDYTLQTDQMRAIEGAQLVILSGAGLEDFLTDVLPTAAGVVHAADGISLLCSAEENSHGDHEHEHAHDPHIWLSPANAKQMARNICSGLTAKYPQYESAFQTNLDALLTDLDALEQYAAQQLSTLSCRELITFHDGFSYLADAFSLKILYAIEEESGSEASALELIDIANLIRTHNLGCIFTERNGSTSASQILSAETGATVYMLDMAMGDEDYFTAMYHNIDTLKEALQ